MTSALKLQIHKKIAKLNDLVGNLNFPRENIITIKLSFIIKEKQKLKISIVGTVKARILLSYA